jgi:hypothetical protein
MPMVKMFVDYGADINISNCFGDNLLQVFLNTPYSPSMGKLVQFLLDDCHAGFLLIKNRDGKTAWDVVMERFIHFTSPSSNKNEDK